MPSSNEAPILYPAMANMPGTVTASILIIEDDPQQLNLYSQALAGYPLTCVTNGSAALKVLEKSIPDLIILDHVLKGGELGTEFLPRLKAVATHVPVIIISGTLGIEEQLKVLQGPESAHYVIKKPVHLNVLRETVAKALDDCGFAELVRGMRSLERAEMLATSDRERLFTERLARQCELRKRLRGATKKPNISELAGEFGVDRHTIRRDLNDLVNRQQLPKLVVEE